MEADMDWSFPSDDSVGEPFTVEPCHARQVWKEIPHTGTGKMDKKSIRAKLEEPRPLASGGKTTGFRDIFFIYLHPESLGPCHSRNHHVCLCTVMYALFISIPFFGRLGRLGSEPLGALSEIGQTFQW